MAEMPGILAWAVAGAKAHFAEGLDDPSAVRSAMESYRAANDPIGQFIDEECLLDPTAREAGSVLYAQYRFWAKQRGLDELNQNSFGRILTRKGFASVKASQVSRIGLRLRHSVGRPEAA